MGSGKKCAEYVTAALEVKKGYYHLGPEHYGVREYPTNWTLAKVCTDCIDWVTSQQGIKYSSVKIFVPAGKELEHIQLLQNPAYYLTALNQLIEWLEIAKMLKVSQTSGFDEVKVLFDETESIQNKVTLASAKDLIKNCFPDYRGI